jgi:hypothetical protein
MLGAYLPGLLLVACWLLHGIQETDELSLPRYPGDELFFFFFFF